MRFVFIVHRGVTVAATALLMAAAACPAAAAAAPAPTVPPTPADTQQALEDILAAHQAAGEFVGARIALRAPDGTVTEATAGTTGLDPASPPVDADVAWNIGSATKTFVAVVVLQLAEQGLLDLDAGVEPYLPDMAGADMITPRQLLQHTSGLGEYLDQPAVVADPTREWTPAELIAVAEAAGRVGEPGGPFHYANTNYIALGEIIEQVTGNHWADEVRSRIVEPLGLSHTSVLTDDQAPAFRLADGTFVDATYSADPSTGGAAGALQSTGRDLLAFMVALTDGTLLTPESWTAMRAFIPGDDLSQFGVVHGYGLGLEQYATEAITVVGHLGSGSHSSFIGYDPASGNAVAVQMNSDNAGPQGVMALEALTAASHLG